MRVLFVGNTAQNGWLLAKSLRAYHGMETSLFHEGGSNPVYSPWWEEGGDPRWDCPDWAFTYQSLNGTLDALFEQTGDFDLVVLVAGFTQAGAYFRSRVPYIVFDCSSLRIMEQRPEERTRPMVAGYFHASHVVLTNADTQPTAQLLVPGRYSFIPHPVNTTMFSPWSRLWGEEELRPGLLDGASLLFFSPTRHDEWCKATSVTVQAFASYCRRADAGLAPPARLILVAHGSDALAIDALCARLSIADRVGWLPTLTKWQLAGLYRAADVVLDQFAPDVGAYGTIAVEALACGTPVVTHIDPQAHAWCAAVAPVPPICLASTAEEAAGHLLLLANAAAQRRAMGEQAREWVEDFHTIERVAGLWAEVCHASVKEPAHAVEEVALV